MMDGMGSSSHDGGGGCSVTRAPAFAPFLTLRLRCGRLVLDSHRMHGRGGRMDGGVFVKKGGKGRMAAAAVAVVNHRIVNDR
jgi:hypothetical protein